MLFVVVEHSSGNLGPIGGIETHGFVSELAFICDPVFFALSGYFAIRPLKTSLKTYYLKKVSGVVLPCLVYSIVLYLYTQRFANLSLGGLVDYQYGLMVGGWWFVPALIPYLVVAPFLYEFFKGLSDRVVLWLARVVAVLTAWGCLSLFLTHVFTALDVPGGATIVGLASQVVPTQLIPGAGYFLYFCLGYFVPRLSATMSEGKRHLLVGIGIVAWVVDAVLFALGFEKADPSYYWLFSTVAVFLVVERLNIKSERVGRVFAWTAKRSFAIYLVQYAVIDYVTRHVYQAGGWFGDVAALPGLGRVGIWLLSIACAYVISLAVASLVDSTLVRLAQRLWKPLINKGGSLHSLRE